ncbi:hypothetical protein [Corynebacterium sputi]|uniref:hypothetical protein n=1 Tax=Corynebacterium sputi TaxID=489915 RepID=UPI000413D0FB|nr:hypothetical protein [Corynebacterium sputi]
MRYTTLNDVRDYEVIPALGEYAADYDVDAIAAEVSRWEADLYPGTSVANAATAGFVVVEDNWEFWDTVQRHALDSL